jgi:DNA invertase Pin-like site-specific DNA recombinase
LFINSLGQFYFYQIKDTVDTSTAKGRLYFNLFASLAEFEHDTIRERTKAGLAADRARGRLGGKSKRSPSGTDSFTTSQA